MGGHLTVILFMRTETKIQKKSSKRSLITNQYVIYLSYLIILISNQLTISVSSENMSLYSVKDILDS